MFNLLIKLMPDDSADSVAVQKQILKIFFALTQYVLPLDLISRYTIFFATKQWFRLSRMML